MKKIFVLLVLLIASACGNKEVKKDNEKENKMRAFLMANKEEEVEIKSLGVGKYPQGSIVDINGKLRVEGTKLINKNGEIIRLRGISSHGLQWYGEFSNKKNLEVLVGDWGIDIYRGAMYTVEGGYIHNDTVKEKIKELAKITEELGIYFIIDWHMLLDNDPNKYKKEAIEFFKEMATLYKDKDHIIFEIANEPNGDEVTWNGSIRPYGVEVVEAIREIKDDVLIIVGTSTWSQDVDLVIGNPLPYENIMYTLHFYAGTHGEYLRQKAMKALENNIPIFVTEWGTTKASGNHGVYIKESKVWLEWMKENDISWLTWNFSNKSEDSAILLPSTSYRDIVSNENLSENGKFIKKALKYNF